MYNSMRFSFILLAGGISERFKSNVPKQYHKIAGKTLIDIAIRKLENLRNKKIILVIIKNIKNI